MNKWLRSFFAVVAISVPVLAVSGEALAGKGGKGGKGAPTSVDAKFSKWMLTPHGTIGGIILENGTIVRVHADAVRDTSLKAGDAIHVDAQALGSVFFKAKITKAGKVVVEDDKRAPGSKGGDKKKHDASKLSAVSVSGTVANVIPGHKGKVHAIVLSDGTAAYAPHGKDAADLGSFGLKKGDAVTVTGKGGTYALGKALVIESIKLPSGDVKKL